MTGWGTLFPSFSMPPNIRSVKDAPPLDSAGTAVSLISVLSSRHPQLHAIVSNVLLARLERSTDPVQTRVRILGRRGRRCSDGVWPVLGAPKLGELDAHFGRTGHVLNADPLERA